ncbi:MAG TPA: YbaB/EbfC family nucleoid-associated protein [Anaerolineae bacterium]|nr:YbaB/EbfC family nucleoid-associated protein [Anaerolineae bacterium]
MPQGGGMGGMLGQLQKLQEEMVKTQEALADETLEVTAGGGAITIVVTGQQRIKSISLSKDVVDPNDVEMLQDLIVAAVNEAIERSQAHAAEKLQGLTGGLGLPPLK